VGVQSFAPAGSFFFRVETEVHFFPEKLSHSNQNILAVRGAPKAFHGGRFQTADIWLYAMFALQSP